MTQELSDAARKAIAALGELSSKKGGLVKKKEPVEMKAGPKLFIGLGGLGCSTLDLLKKEMIKEYGNSGNCAYLAIDTSSADTTVNKLPNLDQHTEVFNLFSDDCIQLPTKHNPSVDKWLNPQFPKDNLKDTGAEGRRQKARLMLCGTSKYNDLKKRINDYANTSIRYIKY